MESSDFYPSIDCSEIERVWLESAGRQFSFYTPVMVSDASESLELISDSTQEMKLKPIVVLIELMLQCAVRIIKQHGYVPKRKENEETPSTQTRLTQALEYIRTGSGDLGFDEKFITSTNGDDFYQRRSLWLLDMMEKGEGVSNFTRTARYALAYGYFEPKAICWFAHKIVNDDKTHSKYRLPDTPADLEVAEKTIDIPGVYELRRVKKFWGRFGPTSFIIAANEQGHGVCFDHNFYKTTKLNLNPGDKVVLRGQIGIKEERYTRLLRVQIKR